MNQLASIWRIEEESLGLLLQKVLEEEGISCELKSEQIPWMDGIMKASRGYWGDLMVLEKDTEQAGRVIAACLEKPPGTP
jgi:hypothetical protein